MKLSTNTTQYHTNIAKAADFGIEDQDLSHIMGILRSQIYTDKLLAVIREYSTNAVDAHKEINSDKPINVTLPTIQRPVLSFRDYGKGLSDEEVCNLYVKYGASTKRSSNDYTGCLGIGCKAGFAYGDDFTVITYTNNKITTWLARIDESQRGTISILNQEDNISEPTGTEIQVSIKNPDIERCVSTAKQFFKYWITQPTCNIDLETINIIESTDDWAIHKSESNYTRNYGGANLVMGNIKYPINNNLLNITNDASNLLKSNSIILYAPMGSVDIAANRESLEYTDRTRNALVAMSNNMLIDLASRTTKHVESQTSRLKASIAAQKYSGILPLSVNKIIIEKCTWNNLPLLNNVSFGSSVRTHQRVKSWNGTIYRNKSDDAMSCIINQYIKLVVYDAETIKQSNATRRIRTLQHESSTPNEDTYYVIPKAQLDQVTPKLTPDDYIDLNTIEPLKPSRTASTITNNNTSKKVRVNVCKLTPHEKKSERLSEECEPQALPDGRFVYVPLDRYDWQNHADWLDNLDQIRQAILYLTNTVYGEKDAPIIHGVKKHHIKNLDDKWITLDDFFNEQFKKWKIKNQHDAELYDQITSTTTSSLPYTEMAEILQQSNDTAIARYGYVISQYYKYYNFGTRSLKTGKDIINIYSVAHFFNTEKRSTYLKDMTLWINKYYPLIEIMSINSWDENKDQIANHIHKYIESITI